MGGKETMDKRWNVLLTINILFCVGGRWHITVVVFVKLHFRVNGKLTLVHQVHGINMEKNTVGK